MQDNHKDGVESPEPVLEENQSPLVGSFKRDILPDCRATVTRGRIFTATGAWVPVFCANCGTDGGMCPEENMTFLFYLCSKCAETHGQIAGTMLMPDEVFFEHMRQEQLEAYGRYLTSQELEKVVEAGASPLATLVKTGL